STPAPVRPPFTPPCCLITQVIRFTCCISDSARKQHNSARRSARLGRGAIIMMNRRAVLLVGVACGSLAAAVPAMAQESGASSSGDIIVTARRVEERLQDVPISITVFSQEQLTKQNVAVATDLATYTPSLSVNQRYGPEKA